MNEKPAIEDWPHNSEVADAVRRTVGSPGRDAGGRTGRSLLMLSGGIDSVALLVNLLEHTDHHVHAHHVELANRENRHIAENEAVSAVVDYCWRRFRDFEYSSSQSGIRVGARGYDLIVTMFHAALVAVASDHDYDFVLTGHFATSDERARYGQGMLDSCFLPGSARPRWVRPLDELPDDRNMKVVIYRSVPPDLAALSWSCRTPVTRNRSLTPCGRCYGCRNLEMARNCED